jgi:transcriptional/translational regulatory protein YebC/TACO1
VAWDFDHVGLIEARADRDDADVDEAAIEAGAQDCEPADEEGLALFITDSSDLDSVCRALPEYGYIVDTAKIGYRAKNPQTIGDAEMEEVEAFLAAIHEHDDVQEVYVALEA